MVSNIHYVLGKNSIDEAIYRLKNNDFPKEINAVIFLLHKPAGQGTKENMLSAEDSRVAEFFRQFDIKHPFKIGMGSCNRPRSDKFLRKYYMSFLILAREGVSVAISAPI